MKNSTVFTIAVVVIGVLILSVISTFGYSTMLALEKQKTPTQTSVYWLCNKDQIHEILVNQPQGISAAIATHCELHTYERKM